MRDPRGEATWEIDAILGSISCPPPTSITRNAGESHTHTDIFRCARRSCGSRRTGFEKPPSIEVGALAKT